MKVSPVLNFSGSCKDALRFYEQAFETKVDFILHYEDANPEDLKYSLTEQQKQFVYHAEMNVGNQSVMFSDIIEFEVTKGMSCFLAITFETKQGLMNVYEKLSTGSKIVVPVKSTTYCSCIVDFVDKFGIRWVLMTETNNG